MYHFMKEEEYVGLVVSMSEKTEEELCAMAESRRMDDIIVGYLVLVLHKIGIDLQETDRIDFQKILQDITAQEAQTVGRLYSKYTR